MLSCLKLLMKLNLLFELDQITNVYRSFINTIFMLKITNMCSAKILIAKKRGG